MSADSYAVQSDPNLCCHQVKMLHRFSPTWNALWYCWIPLTITRTLKHNTFTMTFESIATVTYNFQSVSIHIIVFIFPHV